MIRFDNSYSRLPERFFSREAPTPVSDPRIIRENVSLSKSLGWEDSFDNQNETAQILSGNRLIPGTEPIAMAYAGHQFGNFVPSLGDGRAHLLGEIIDPTGKRWDLHLKGSGRTNFSRRGDGRSPLGAALREYIISEAMHGLGVPTTRSLGVVATGETVIREKATHGGILARVSASHIRVGTFEYFAAKKDSDALRRLADYTIKRLYPDVQESENPYLDFFTAVVDNQASLISKWMQFGFIHGVMNTDNMAISGETIDYGPCAFLDIYHPDTAFSSIDVNGRYAFGNQPYVAYWNLARFAESLAPLIDTDQAKGMEQLQTALENFVPAFETFWTANMLRKLGIRTKKDDDREFIGTFLDILSQNKLDYTLTFRTLSDLIGDFDNAKVQQIFVEPGHKEWLDLWISRLNEDPASAEEKKFVMKAANPAYIPRNHLVEEAIETAVEDNNYERMDQLLDAVSKPFEERTGLEKFKLPPESPSTDYRTFCGT